jgi:hypothetical protein
VLALFFGNQTPYFLDEAGGMWIIGTFLTAKGSFVAMEVFYSCFIPSLRREVLVTFLISIPVAVLWGGAVWLDWPARGALVLPAVIFEGIVSAIIALPVGDWFLRGAPKKALDPDNFVDRLQGFFIIVVGVGVYALISGNDWGVVDHLLRSVLAILHWRPDEDIHSCNLPEPIFELSIPPVSC